MRKFWQSKKFLFLILALIIVGLFVYFLLIPKTEIPLEVKKKETLEKIPLFVSSVYRYDFKKREYFPDSGKSWQNYDFVRYIYDLAPENKKLENCYYFFYDNIKKRVTTTGQRKCNSNLTITVGENKDCPSQGENACTLYVYAEDNSGRQGKMEAITYHIDWERPKVGKVFRKDNIYLAEVSDNLEVGYCWLYLNNENIGLMNVEDGLASLEYTTKEEQYTIRVRCADHYTSEKEKYLNLTFGEAAEFGSPPNHPPEISLCRVIPTQGSIETEFKFEIDVSDPDGDVLFYRWDFGDGEESNEQNPFHQYQKTGTFEPEILVSDGKEKVECHTAWVVVSKE